GQAAGALADPWILLTVPLVAGIAIGLAIGLKFAAALIALAAGVGFLMFLTGLTSLTASVVHLLLRDRRRGEIVMFLVVVLIPIVAMGPQLLLRSERHSRKLTRAERAALPPSRLEQVVVRMAPYVPSEMYRRAAI